MTSPESADGEHQSRQQSSSRYTIPDALAVHAHRPTCSYVSLIGDMTHGTKSVVPLQPQVLTRYVGILHLAILIRREQSPFE
jgi:hypothetical protein